MTSVIDYQNLIREHEVHASLYTNRQVFEDELQNIWYNGWVYIGHESEIAHTGDYCTKQLGLQPVIMTKDDHGKIHVFMNRCPHVGNLLCHHEKGNSRAFRCLYHGWTFKNTGELLGLPYKAGYGSCLEHQSFTLKSVPRVEVYRGFVFANMNAEGISLLEHLGNSKDAIDQLCDLSPEGKIDLSSGWLKHKTKTNWKIIYENEVDGYHANFVHQSLKKLNNWSLVAEADAGSEHSASLVRYLGNGHADIDWRPQFQKLGKKYLWVGSPREDQLASYQQKMENTWGKSVAEQKLIDGPPHTLIFPNLFIAELFILVIQPVDVGTTIQYQTPILWKGADDLNKRVLKQTGGSIGPAGMVLADDSAMYERNYLGLQAQTPEWLVRSRGLEREKTLPNGLIVSNVTDDTAHRGFWKNYRSRMVQN